MWPFKRAEPDPGASWVQEIVQRINVNFLELERRTSGLENTLQLLAEGVASAKAIERRLGTNEMGLRQLAAAQNDDVARLTAALEVVRGMATGARGGRPRNEEREADRQALELGRRVIQAAATAEGRAQLAAELAAGPSGEGADPVGQVKWQPGRTNGNPV